MSELRVDNIVDMGGSGAPQLRKGANVTGISTITQAVVGNATINAGGINATGIVTSSSNKFVGDFASGNITAGVMTATSSVVASNITINSGGVNASGIVSATSYAGSGANLTGIGLTIAPLAYNPDVSDLLVTAGTGIGFTFNQRVSAGVGTVTLSLVSVGSTVAEVFGLGNATSTTYTVTVSNPGSGNKYYLDGNLSYNPVLYPGSIYTFDQSNATNGSHPLRFATAADAAGSTEYTTGVETNGTPGNSGAYTRITVATDAPTPLYYYCTNHSGMGSYVNIGNNVSIDNSGTLPKLSFTPVNDLGLDSVIFVDIPDGSITKMDGTSLSPTSWTFTTENVFKYWVAGENNYGQLGLNEAGTPISGGPTATANSRSSPTQLTSTAWSAINSSHYSSLGRKPAGTLWSWGYQSNRGELGHNQGANTNNKSSPTQIPGTTWSKSVAVGAYVMASTKTDGTLWMWGTNTHGNLAQNSTSVTGYSSPIQVGSDTTWPTGIDKIASGYYTHAIKTDGTLWAWGRDWEFGMSGLNFIGNRSSPTQIPGTTWSNVVSGFYVVSALKTDGTLWMWGQSGSGSLGDNSRTSRSSPIQVPGTWSSHSTTHMGGGSAAINTDGELFMWGDNSVGTLGQNDRTSQSSPVQVPGTTWSRITQAAENSFVVTKTDGTAWVWGQNEHGMLGQNNLTKYSSPVQIPGTTWQYNLNSGAFLAIGKP